jgi:hypothetical protein
MNLLLSLSSLMVLVNSQIISMAVCKDLTCSKECVYWTATSGKCAPCQGTCSLTNPSSVVTTSSITLYSDSTCQQVIPGTQQMQLLVDRGCNTLIAENANTIGSYRASNISAVIGSVVGGIVFVIGLSVCLCCFCKKRRQQQQQQGDPIALPDQGQAYVVPLPYLTNQNNSSPPSIQPIYYPNQYMQGQTYYPTNIPTAQPYYTPTVAPTAVQGQQYYYPPPPPPPQYYKHDAYPSNVI